MGIKEKINKLDKCYKGYDLISIQQLNDLDSVGLILKHVKSGARVVVISNTDDNKVFSIGFRTPPDNDKGIQHIIEHSVLCGSKKYPVKDPFVELCKGSLNTFLNAMTYPDKTIYPVASCNMADFKNITDVYMDAVFNPDIYKHPEIFKQEGWHYELEDRESDINYNGVVFNEMKGVFSSPDDLLSRYTFSELFPDTPYKNESGGDPKAIPSLSYEEFLKYHSEYYHPVNSYIYMYGDMDVDERLEYLDREYLSNFDKNDVNIDSHIEIQKPFAFPVEKVYEYAVSDEESLEDNTYLSYNIVVGKSTDPVNYLGLQILDYALILAPGAPLKQALIDAGIGTDVYSSLETSVYQPVYSIVAKNANASQKEDFVRVIEETLSKLANDGLNERMIKAGINYYEFKCREADFGPYPKGLMYYLTMMDSWLYDDEKPFVHLEESKTLDKIKELSQKRYFEDYIKEQLLDNMHKAVITLIPKHGLDEEKKKQEEKELREYKAGLSDSQLDEIINETKRLKEYQDTPSSQEDLKKIPQLELKDISTEPAKIYIDPVKVNGIDVIRHNMFTNSIAYIILAFNCEKVPDELLPYLGILSSALSFMDTEKYSYSELTSEININCGGITSDASVYTDATDFDKVSIYYEVKGKVLYEKTDFVLDMMNEIIYKTRFDDCKRLREIIAKLRSRMESSMMSIGHSVAMMACVSQYSKSARYSSMIKGYEFYKVLQNIDNNFDELKDDLIDKLNNLVEYIFDRDNLIVSLTADNSGFECFEKAFSDFSNGLKKSDIPVCERKFVPQKVKLGYTSASQVQYVARCGNYVNHGYSYTGALKVLKVIFSYDYLWINVRVKGGAYGCMSGAYRNGDMYMVSYRDPNLSKTNEIYEHAADYIKEFDVSERDMVKFIIGTIGEMDTPMNPSAKGVRSFGMYLSNITYEQLKKERMQVLECDVNAIRQLAPLVSSAVSDNYFCVVGNQKVIQDEAGMFDEIKPLIITD